MRIWDLAAGYLNRGSLLGEHRLLNAIEHMWGYVRDHASAEDLGNARTSTAHLLVRTQRLALRHRHRFLLSSTALSELAVFVEAGELYLSDEELR
jgi:hypothetical protein